MSRGADKPFGITQRIRFGTSMGAYSKVTETESGDSQITLSGHEKDLAISHFGANSFLRGPKNSDPQKALKELRLYPTGIRITVNLGFFKINAPNELRLYLSYDNGFRPHDNDIWFIYKKDGDLWVGFMESKSWLDDISTHRNDENDDLFQQQLCEDNEVKITKLKARDVYSRDRKIALARFDESNYRCEIDDNCRQFIARSTGKPYVEAHHLIPVSAQSQFDSSLDIVENVFSLCPHCHQAIHHAERDVTVKMLETLSLKRPVLELHSLNLLDLTNLYGLEKLN